MKMNNLQLHSFTHQHKAVSWTCRIVTGFTMVSPREKLNISVDRTFYKFRYGLVLEYSGEWSYGVVERR
jgi:hypothetical protein